MCGIFGAVILPSSPVYKKSRSIARDLFRESERRGKEASGIVFASIEELGYLKYPGSFQSLWKNAKVILQTPTLSWDSFAFIGHTRLVTNGALDDNRNNQPVRVGNTIGVHNGIIVNDKKIWENNPTLKPASSVDTEALVAVVDTERKKKGIIAALQSAYHQIYGTASTALLFSDADHLALSTNNGSLYAYHDNAQGIYIFASEFRILDAVVKKHLSGNMVTITNLQPNRCCVIGLSDLSVQNFSLNETGGDVCVAAKARVLKDYSTYPPYEPGVVGHRGDVDAKIIALYERTKRALVGIRRCTRCILPETFPGIVFDDNGVCDICLNYRPIVLDPSGGEGLKKLIHSRERSNKSKIINAELVMGFSGGRDSCYGLHYLVKELGLRPIVYTYDWGVITDLGRRNQSRLCAKLGIEHVLVSADIAKKREYVRKNILAWMRDPDLGMVPLFMAGDKQYFSHLNYLARDLAISNILLCENPLERTLFKYRFANMNYDDLSTTTYQTSWTQKEEILHYYGKKFLTNSGYWNASLGDTFSGFISYFIHSNATTYQQLFSYIPWDEKLVDATLLSEYDWEFSPDAETSWRIGDGTAPWYNLIYYIGAGFSEQETFRSNQIREGYITRAEGLRLAERDNYPRIPSLRWYFETMQVDLESAIESLSRLPRRYAIRD